MAQNIQIPIGSIPHEALLAVPQGAQGLVIFAHGSGSGRLSPRNNYVAGILNNAGFATLLLDLLTEEEDTIYENRFDIPLLAERLKAATKWANRNPATQSLAIGYFGASTGAAAALIAAADIGPTIKAVVSRGGRPDLAGEAFPRVQSPTLLIVGGDDTVVIGLNQNALAHITCQKELKIIPGATHLFEEPGTLEEASRLATQWFKKHL